MNKLILVCIISFFSFFVFAQYQYPNVINYEINLDITDFSGRTISGYTELTLTTNNQTIDNIALDLLKLNLDSISSEDLTISNIQYNDSLILFNISPAINVEDTVKIKIYYHGSPVVDPSGWGGFYFSGERAYNLGVGFEDIPHNYGRVWFPCVDNFTDKATYRCKITVLENHKAICGGLLQSVSDVENGKHTYEWFLSQPIPTYLASVAVGEYALYESTYHGIERDIPIQVYVYPSQLNKVQGTLVNFDSIVSIYESKFGPYLWDRIGFVAVPFSSGAMEHATNIAMPSSVFTGNTSYEDLFAHEFAHHWFGDAVTCSSAEDMWLNEGWATYCESLYREFLYGRNNMLNYRRNTHAEVLRYAHIEDEGFLALNDIPLDKTYSTTVYKKGAGAAHSLRGYLGDNIFFDAISALINHFKFNNISSNDMSDFLSNYTGINMSDWFEGWVFTPGFPHFAIDSVKIEEINSIFETTVFVKQKMRGRNSFVNSNKIPITFIFPQYNDTTCFVNFDGEYGVASFTFNEMPKFTFCDYYETMSDASVDQFLWLKNSNVLNLPKLYARIKASNLSADSVFIRITHNWVAPDTMKQKIDGLFLANNRYWLIEGDFNENCTMKCEFQYGNTASSALTGYLDNEFINNSLDSLVLMYRPNKATEWQIVEFTNQTVQKKLITENLLPGEYALGIRNWNAWVHNKTIEKTLLSIYPNPSNDLISLNFSNPVSGKIRVFNSTGALVFENIILNNTNYSFSIGSYTDGIYFIQFDNKESQEVIFKKVIKERN